jgi:ISXO2-like transposase domain
MAEEYFSRLRRAEIGIHHHIAGSYLLRYAQESSWREDNRRVSNRDQVNRIEALAMKREFLATSSAARTHRESDSLTTHDGAQRARMCQP